MALDHQSYPHILERVLAASSWSSKLRLRCLSRHVRDLLDADLFHHIVLSGQPAAPRHWAPGSRPLPPLLRSDPDTPRKLAHVRILDWGIRLPHHATSIDPEEDEVDYRRFQGLSYLAPFLAHLKPAVIRGADAQLIPLAAPHMMVYNNYLTLPRGDSLGAGPWMHWGEGLLLLPFGVRSLTLHIRFDPRHPALLGGRWDVSAVGDYPLHEVTVLPRPTLDLACERTVPHIAEPVLGFLDDLLRWGIRLARRGARVTFVGFDTLPPATLNLRAEAGADEREEHILAGLKALAGPAGECQPAGEIRRISWDEYRAETPRETYALALVRPRFVRPAPGARWRDDARSIYPRSEHGALGRSGSEGPSYLDWLASGDVPPPLSPRMVPLDGEEQAAATPHYVTARGRPPAVDST